MRVLVFEDNLIWSSRLAKSLRALGHEPIVRTSPISSPDGAEFAIVNLGSERLSASDLVPALREGGVITVGHAGHKETELLSYGRDSGCDLVVTNSQLTFKLAEVIGQLFPSQNQP